jgi:DNA replication protein DnaC
MIKLRKCYGKDAEISEDEFIKRMLNLDLLVIDEIGLQKNTDSEKLVLNQIIDQRVSRLKSTGILTNLGGEDLTKFLGVRIISRLKMNNGQWIVFNWEDYRK